MPPSRPHNIKTPPGGYPACEGCMQMTKIIETLYGDEYEIDKGIVKSTKEIKETLEEITRKFDVMIKVIKWVFPGSLAALIGLIILIIQFIEKIK